MIDFSLFCVKEKDLVHMLFKEYVPRFSHPMYQNKPYLQQYRIELQPGKEYLYKMACLELKGMVNSYLIYVILYLLQINLRVQTENIPSRYTEKLFLFTF